MFEDRSKSAGLAWQESYASPTFGDFNNDGIQDFFFTTVYGVGSGNIPNYPVLYQGSGDWTYQDVTEAQQISKQPPTYQAAWADIDNDGDLDLCTAGKIFRNDNELNGKWIKIRLVGDGKKANRSGIGATVRIRAGDQIITRHVESGTGEGNQNDLTLHFGFGDLKADLISAEVTWPGNYKQIVDGLNLDATHNLPLK